ncbi:hypothetical protein HAX54_048768 [Datura stramonium]|uniref:Uncharacterized protein n=1 Tax=Datura stramonium TaxID=4076 RepID=A0ABS8WJM1_DATST|nr:hypothetical protein [Datura stramonium]
MLGYKWLVPEVSIRMSGYDLSGSCPSDMTEACARHIINGMLVTRLVQVRPCVIDEVWKEVMLLEKLIYCPDQYCYNNSIPATAVVCELLFHGWRGDAQHQLLHSLHR